MTAARNIATSIQHDIIIITFMYCDSNKIVTSRRTGVSYELPSNLLKLTIDTILRSTINI